MSSRDEKGTPLYSVPDATGYRLIELSSDVQSLLEADDAQALTLESTDHAGLLKTPTGKTYSLRQKNTSNTLVLLRPHASDPSSTVQGLAAISTIQETVELEAVHEDAPDVVPGNQSTSKGKWHERFAKGR